MLQSVNRGADTVTIDGKKYVLRQRFICKHIHRGPLKRATSILTTTLSNADRSSKYFSQLSAINFQQNPFNNFHFTLYVLLHYLGKVRRLNLFKINGDMALNHSTFDRTETFHAMQLNRY